MNRYRTIPVRVGFYCRWIVAATVLLCLALASMNSSVEAAELFTPEDVLNTRYAGSARISPDGKWIAYTVSVARDVDDEAGGRYAELHVASTQTGQSRAYVSGKVNVSDPQWSPDGKLIAFRLKRGTDAKTQVWAIPIDGGEAKQATASKSDVLSFEWRPSGNAIAYIAVSPETERAKALEKKGYGFKYVEENLMQRNLYLTAYDPAGKPAAGKSEILVDQMAVWTFKFSPSSDKIALSASPRPLIDENYAFRKIYLFDFADKSLRQFSNNTGKLGSFEFSPDGERITYMAALDRSDHAVSQVFVQRLSDEGAKNLTPSDFRGHVQISAWKDDQTVWYFSGEGVWDTLSAVDASGGKRQVLLHSRELGVGFEEPHHTDDFKHFAFVGSSNEIPADVYYWNGADEPKRLTDLNRWVADRQLGKVEVYNHKARDGWPVEGLLYYPTDYQAGQRCPLIVFVHGGPESHYSNHWRTSYSTPVQVLTGQGYVVWLPNYRSSTGYGLAHIAQHMGDPAGVEFDDVADGIDHLIKIGLVDERRVGLAGGSYGGFAAAWFATYYTEKVRAVFMFVGLSNLISKRGTTDIPYEELYVHSGKKLEEMWDISLERSPIYHAHRSRTATLIAGGTADTRVHPAQSLELFRRMKMNDHPAVRLVQYPGEGHGNRKLPARRDVLFRMLDWFGWYVKDLKPLDGPMPPLDISDRYGLDLPEEEMP